MRRHTKQFVRSTQPKVGEVTICRREEPIEIAGILLCHIWNGCESRILRGEETRGCQEHVGARARKSLDKLKEGNAILLEGGGRETREQREKRKELEEMGGNAGSNRSNSIYPMSSR